MLRDASSTLHPQPGITAIGILEDALGDAVWRPRGRDHPPLYYWRTWNAPMVVFGIGRAIVPRRASDKRLCAGLNFTGFVGASSLL
jgi:hypothetical protein